MVDMAMISGAMTAFKAVRESAKALVTIHDASVIRAKVIELNTQITTAQESALSALSDQFSLLERIGDLEKQVTEFEKWETQKQKYELKIVARGATVYALKESEYGSEPPHWICTTCYQQRKNSVFQYAGPAAQSGADFNKMKWRCAPCGMEIRVPLQTSPTRPSNESEM
jgi:hypothetical protein